MNATLWTPTLSLFAIALACFCAAAVTMAQADELDARSSSDDQLPATLEATGFNTTAGVVEFQPQYPLWTDGADKRRWLALPRGSAIDATKPDEWQFPRGTKLWKQFSFNGKPAETRYIEHGRDGVWRFAAYVWNDAGTEATLAPKRGTAVKAPHGRHDIPSRSDCIACHGSAPVPVLGASALQLSSSLRDLVARGLVRGLPQQMLREPPQVAAATPVERAALGYLHGNCAHCHNTGPTRAPLALTLAQRAADPAASRAEVLRSTVHAPSRYRTAEGDSLSTIVVPGAAGHSVLAHRMQSRDPRIQMPPLGTAVADEQGIALIRRWIGELPSTSSKESQP
ncbi:MAG: hypothetical protein HY854_14145 [Burkholderiales bacterium]|nr:hypothetical protein [Burkholderiales bacterium]